MPWAGVGAPILGTAGLIAPAFGFAGAFDPFPVGAFGFGAFGGAGLGFFGATVADGTVSPWLTPFLAPTLTSSALMFNDLAMTSAMMPLTFNVTFTAASAQAATMMNTASLSLFATPIASTALTTAAIPFSSMAFPIAMPLAAVAPWSPHPWSGHRSSGPRFRERSERQLAIRVRVVSPSSDAHAVARALIQRAGKPAVLIG